MNADLETLQKSNKTELERRGSILNIGAPATEAVTIRDQIAVGFGDGTVTVSYTHLTLPTKRIV